jgi:sugar/nucleoside kinase (ribokinase family)
MTKVACIGECMIELKQAQGGLYSRGYGGDTLNTANYLARLGADVDYITALGDDPMSEEMLAGWAAEGVGTSQVLRLPGKLPGIYMIQTDDAGERRFFHWRENSAARSLMDRPETGDVLRSLASYDLVYLSAITLSLYSESGRRQLIAALRSAREAGARVPFDTNFRIRGWPDLDIARADVTTSAAARWHPAHRDRRHGTSSCQCRCRRRRSNAWVRLPSVPRASISYWWGRSGPSHYQTPPHSALTASPQAPRVCTLSISRFVRSTVVTAVES